MTASEILVPSQERADAAAMLQDYIAEMAQFAPDVRAGQAYPYFDLYWSEPDSRWPFWLKLDDARAGFAFVRRDEAGMQMAEFFVARQYRCRGVGLGAARRLIARFSRPVADHPAREQSAGDHVLASRPRRLRRLQ